MSEQTNTQVITINIKDLWEIFLRRLWIILLVGILAFSAFCTFKTVTYDPKYSSSATIYILQQNQAETKDVYDDFNLALKVVNDCSHLIKSHSVLDTVINKLELDMSYKALYNNVKITNPADTRILEIEVISDSPQLAKEIVDEICTVGTEKITETMGFKQVHFYERGILNNNPCNQTSLIVYLFIGFAAMFLTYAVFVLIYLFDDKLHTDEDIKNHLDLSILGDIPYVGDTKNKKRGNMAYYRSKYYR